MRPKLFVWSLPLACLAPCFGQLAPLDPAKVDHAYTFARSQLADSVGRIAPSAYPTITSTTSGAWSTGTTRDWRAGFFPGQLWHMYAATGDAIWRTEAMRWTNNLTTTNITNDHDIGFVTITTWGPALRLGSDRAYKNTARNNILNNAQILSNRFYAPIGMIDSWNNLEEPWGVAIDNMMNLELMFEARVQGGDATIYDRAVAHADSTRDKLVRADGSTYHVVRHNDNGTIQRKNTMQGYGDETTWSRGQAWAIHGFTTTYRYTRDPAFLATAQQTADYFIRRLPHNLNASTDPHNALAGDWVAPSDFDAERGEPEGAWNDADNDGIPNETNSGNRPGTAAGTTPYVNDRLLALNTFTLRDSSAAAIAASGLLELATLVPADTAANRAVREKYFGTGRNILNSLLTHHDANAKLNYLADGATASAGSPLASILARGSELWNAPNRGLSYGDYYLLEALRRYERVGLDFLPLSVGNQWNGASAAWSDGSRWTSGDVPDGVGAAAHFRAMPAAAVTVTNDAARTVGSITFNNPNKFTIAGSAIRLQDFAEATVRVNASPAGGHEISAPLVIGGDTTFDAGPGTALRITGAVNTDPAGAAKTVTKRGSGAVTFAAATSWSTGSEMRMQEGSLALNADAGAAGKRLTFISTGGDTVFNATQQLLALHASGDATVVMPPDGTRRLSVNGLSITDNAIVNISDNDFFFDYAPGAASPEDAIRALVREGRLATLDTPENDTVLALADNAEWGRTEFQGRMIDESMVVGLYTFYGDANFDGKVTGDDYVAIDANLGTGDSWLEGDFNMDGITSGDDYVAIDANLGKGTTDPLALAELKAQMIAAHVEMFGGQYLVQLAAAKADGFQTVPEPAGMAGCIAAIATLLHRRREKDEFAVGCAQKKADPGKVGFEWG